MANYKEVLDKIKALFSIEEVKEQKLEEQPSEQPQEPAVDEVSIEDKVSALESRIDELEKLLEGADLKMKEKDTEMAELSKQIADKDKAIEDMKVELSKTPASEPIMLEKQTKKLTFADRMSEQLKAQRKELGLE